MGPLKNIVPADSPVTEAVLGQMTLMPSLSSSSSWWPQLMLAILALIFLRVKPNFSPLEFSQKYGGQSIRSTQLVVNSDDVLNGAKIKPRIDSYFQLRPLFFNKMCHPRPLFHLFSSFHTNTVILTTLIKFATAWTFQPGIWMFLEHQFLL